MFYQPLPGKNGRSEYHPEFRVFQELQHQIRGRNSTGTLPTVRIDGSQYIYIVDRCSRGKAEWLLHGANILSDANVESSSNISQWCESIEVLKDADATAIWVQKEPTEWYSWPLNGRKGSLGLSVNTSYALSRNAFQSYHDEYGAISGNA